MGKGIARRYILFLMEGFQQNKLKKLSKEKWSIYQQAFKIASKELEAEGYLDLNASLDQIKKRIANKQSIEQPDILDLRKIIKILGE